VFKLYKLVEKRSGLKDGGKHNPSLTGERGIIITGDDVFLGFMVTPFMVSSSSSSMRELEP